MKNLSLIFSAVLAIAVIILFVLFLSSKKVSNAGSQTVSGESSSGAVKLVYVNTDSLLFKYTLAKELNEDFLKKYEDRMTELNTRAKSLEREYADFQRKVENNGFLTEARAVEARDNLLVKEQKLKNLQQSMNEDSNREQAEMNKRLYDEITSFLNKFNESHDYDLILGVTGGTVLYSKSYVDITDAVLKELNAKYKSKSE